MFLFLCRKLAKSTLVLVLVFGVHYIVFVGMPHTFTGLGWELRMYCELFFNSFQVSHVIPADHEFYIFDAAFVFHF